MRKILTGLTALAALTLLGAPSMASATEVCTETIVETNYDVEEYALVTPAVPAIPEVPAVEATPHEGLLEVAGDWATDSISTGWTGTIADLPGLDIVADPIQYVGLHIITPEGTLVYEEEPSYGGKLWSNTPSNVPAGMGYASFGTIEEFAAAHGGIPVTDVFVLYTHPEASSTIVSSVTIGGEVITFAEGNPGSPAIPAVPEVPAVYEWVIIGDEWFAEAPEDEEGLRYIETNDTREVEVEIECPPTETPKPTEPPTTQAPSTPDATIVTPTSATLAETGASPMPYIISAGVGLALGAILLGVGFFNRRKAHQ